MDYEHTKALIIADEGLKQFLYNDLTGKRIYSEKGKMTCGIGRNVEDKGFSLDEIGLMFDNDIQHCVDSLHARLPFFDQLKDEYQYVLVNMAFNMGIDGLMAFHQFLHFMSVGAFISAAADLRTTQVYKQLPSRYERLCVLLEKGEWQ